MAYDASQFTVLKGLEPVRVRPGMYTRTENPLHILQEVIDNAADEALAGHAKTITVSLGEDGSATVQDDGRGIPVGIPPGESRPAVELAFAALHAGGKFDKAAGESAYRFSGGLHGVGIAVTNALSKRVEVEVKTRDPDREGNGQYRLVFTDSLLVEPLTRLGDVGPRTHGTTVRVWPDPQFFDSPRIPQKELIHLLRSKAILLPGLKVLLSLPDREPLAWQYEDGMSQYLGEALATSESVTPIFAAGLYQPDESKGFAEGEGGAWAMAWTTDSPPTPETYVNLIPTPAGGTHESGFRAGVFEAVKSFLEHHSLLPAKVKLVQEDVTGHLAFLLSARILDPQFQGQTKDRLSSRDAHKLLTQSVKDRLELWLSEHPDAGRAVAELAIQSANARTKAAQKVERKKGSGLATLPGKLTDCESEDISRNEIFLVEGDSAGGSAKMARDKEFQAILPLRGKVLNTWEIEADRIFGNNEVHDLSVAFGIDPHCASTDPATVLANLRYGKIIVLSDADVDGSHIQVLLLTLFLRHFPALLLAGHVFVAKPPLYRVDATVRGQVKKIYCEAEGEREAAIARFQSEGVKPDKISVQRFKGLGEMNPEQLWETSMCPDTRTLVAMHPNPDALPVAYSRFDLLMSKQAAGDRRQWMERDGWRVELDV